MERERERGEGGGGVRGGEDWQSTAPFASLSLSNRWANYCCSTQRALDGSNTLMNTDRHIHTQLHRHVYIPNRVLYSMIFPDIDVFNQIIINKVRDNCASKLLDTPLGINPFTKL